MKGDVQWLRIVGPARFVVSIISMDSIVFRTKTATIANTAINMIGKMTRKKSMFIL